MTMGTREPDNITLDLAKQHLIVTHSADDAIIQEYIDASRSWVEAYTHTPVLMERWDAEPHEMTPKDDGYYHLAIPYPPRVIFYEFGSTSEMVAGELWEWHAGTLRIRESAIHTPLSFQALCGLMQFTESVKAARLMLIGTYYNYRESVADLRVVEVPFTVRSLLDSVTGVAL